MLALVDGEPKVLTLKQTIEQYVKFQVEVIRRRTEYDLKKAKHRAHILEGLVIAADNIDEVVEICKTSENIPHSKQRLQERFNLTEIQAEAIVQMTLGKLTGLERQKILDELDELMKKIEELEAILADENKVHQIIKDELAEIRRKYSDDRRTQIETVSGEVDIEDLIPVEDCVVRCV